VSGGNSHATSAGPYGFTGGTDQGSLFYLVIDATGVQHATADGLSGRISPSSGGGHSIVDNRVRVLHPDSILSWPNIMSDSFARPLVVSPHFDDAVFSCGAMLAAHPGTVVYTVLSGCPAADVTTDWDHHCGFDSAVHAMHERSLEDQRALAVLDAVPDRGDFLDAQYVPFVPHAHAPTRDAIAQALERALRRHAARTLVVPLGLFHSDHELVHRACADVWRANPGLACFAYEDALYRRLAGQLQTRMADLVSRGVIATPAIEHWRSNPSHQAAKRDAVKAYASQLKAFGADGYDDVFCTERCWKLELGG
jgi:LmbE family N-acetylglucosaminyl deacetylase